MIEYCKDWRQEEPTLLSQRALDWVHGHDYDQIADDVSTLVTFLNLERLLVVKRPGFFVWRQSCVTSNRHCERLTTRTSLEL